MRRTSAARRFGFAWVGFGLAVALHVADEAAHQFLAVYNPTAGAIRARLPFLPLPTFTLATWLTSLAVAVGLFLCASPFAFRGRRGARRAAVPLAVVFGILNGCSHILASVWVRRWMPGVYSSPVLLAGGIFLLLAARGGQAQAAGQEPPVRVGPSRP